MASRKDHLRKLWDDSAAEYHHYAQRFWTHRRITTTLMGLLNAQPARVLDFGCGPGNSTRLLGEMLPNARIVGLDSSQRMIEIANSATAPSSTITYICAEASALVPLAESFDLIVCSNSFFHVQDKQALLDDFHRLLNPGGHVIFSMYEFLFRPSQTIHWPYEERADDDLMPKLLERLNAEGYLVTSRKEDREIFDEATLSRLFSQHNFALRCGGILRLHRTREERLAFFRIPSVAHENFPNIPYDIVAKALDQIADNNGPLQQRNVYAFIAARTPETDEMIG